MTRRDGKPCKRCGTSAWDDNSYCLQCKKDNTRRWREGNKEHLLEYARTYREKNRQRIRDRHRGYSRQWYRKNREGLAEKNRRWQKQNPEKVAAISSRYRARKMGSDGNFTTEEFRRLCEKYGNRCLCCGRDDVALHADHVVPLTRGGRNDISNIQPLCKSCNSAKATRIIDYRTKGGVRRWIQKRLL